MRENPTSATISVQQTTTIACRTGRDQDGELDPEADVARPGIAFQARFDPRGAARFRYNGPMLRAACVAALFLASSCAMNPAIPESLRAEMAPGGVLRAGVNLG